jgi:transposase InsO family protein
VLWLPQDARLAHQAVREHLREGGSAPDEAAEPRPHRASAPNEKWLTDITEFQIPAGKVYLTVTASSDRPVVHSDRGGHYRWPGWLSRIAEAQLVRSMSHKACSPGNAACEGFFGRLKNEWFYSRVWLSKSIEEFVAALDAYIRWYNEARIKISLGSRSPVEHRRELGIAA